jgi:hypothetical protein
MLINYIDVLICNYLKTVKKGAKMNKSDSIAALSEALAKAQGEFSPLAKNRSVKIQMKSGGSFNFKYADLEATINSTRPALSKNGLAVIQPIVDDKLLTIITHSSGEFIESSMPLPSQIGDDPKQYGAKISYLRRYAYQSLVCVMADDDLDESSELPYQAQSEQQQPAKPTLTKDAFDAACEKIKTNPDLKIKLLSNYDLTTEQRNHANSL